MNRQNDSDNQSRANHYEETAGVFQTGSSIYIGLGILCASAYFAPESVYENFTSDTYDANKMIDTLAVGGTATSIVFAGLCSAIGYGLAARGDHLRRQG